MCLFLRHFTVATEQEVPRPVAFPYDKTVGPKQITALPKLLFRNVHVELYELSHPIGMAGSRKSERVLLHLFSRVNEVDIMENDGFVRSLDTWREKTFSAENIRPEHPQEERSR